MRQNKFVKVVKILLFVIVAAAVLGFVVKELWNALLPPIFGWHLITFWQALGLLILSKILFGGFHRHAGRRNHWKDRMTERWIQMTPEQREQFLKGMRCGGRRSPFAPQAEQQP